MARRTLSYIAIAVGAALIVIAVLLPTMLVPKLRSLPLDTVNTTSTELRSGAILDSNQLAQNEPVPNAADDERCNAEGDVSLPVHCFINTEAEIRSVRHVRMQDPADAEVVTFEVGTSILRNDKEEPANLINATVDRITMDRFTQFPIYEPTSTIQF